MDQDLVQSVTALPEPMACSEPPALRREDAFTDLLLTLSHKMSPDNAKELSFAAECSLPGTPTTLDVLQDLRKRGVFSPQSCDHLEGLLRRIHRCDLADLVGRYMKDYPPDPPPATGKRHTSMQEKGSDASGIPLKRCLTDPPPSQLHHDQPQATWTIGPPVTEGPQVQQEQTTDRFSQLHVSSGARQLTSTPKHRTSSQSQDSSPDHELLVGTHATNRFKSPNGGDPHPSYIHEPAEPLSMKTSCHRKTSSYDQSTHTPTSFSSEQSHMSYNLPPGSKGSQDTYSRSSKSATVSRESSFRSLCSSSQHSSLQDKASQMAHMAIDLMAHVSRERLSGEWYISSSISSLSSSVRALSHSDTNSVHSECESTNPKPWKKKHSQSFHGNHSSRAPRKITQRRPSAPPRYRHQEMTHVSQHQSERYAPLHSPAATDEVDSEDSWVSENRHESEERNTAGPTEDSEPVADEDSAMLTLRPKKNQRGRSNSEQSENQRLSVISDATPRQSMVIDPATVTRHSMISEATSEGTVTSPTASMLGRDDVGEPSTDDRDPIQKPAPSFPKEKSLLRRLSFFRNKSRTNSLRSFTWKVVREELMKPVWRHQYNFSISRPGKFELDVNFGKHNPKLSFLLYPNGLFEDKGKAVTMAVRIMTPDKCPPLPPSSEIHMKLVVWGGESGEVEVRRCPGITERLSMRVFYVYTLITHDQLKESHCKHFILDVEVSCSGVQRESYV